jgi:hypothetical protein
MRIKQKFIILNNLWQSREESAPNVPAAPKLLTVSGYLNKQE